MICSDRLQDVEADDPLRIGEVNVNNVVYRILKQSDGKVTMRDAVRKRNITYVCGEQA